MKVYLLGDAFAAAGDCPIDTVGVYATKESAVRKQQSLVQERCENSRRLTVRVDRGLPRFYIDDRYPITEFEVQS